MKKKLRNLIGFGICKSKTKKKRRKRTQVSDEQNKAWGLKTSKSDDLHTLQVIHWEEDHDVAEKSKIELTNGEGFFLAER